MKEQQLERGERRQWQGTCSRWRQEEQKYVRIAAVDPKTVFCPVVWDEGWCLSRKVKSSNFFSPL